MTGSQEAYVTSRHLTLRERFRGFLREPAPPPPVPKCALCKRDIAFAGASMRLTIEERHLFSSSHDDQHRLTMHPHCFNKLVEAIEETANEH